MDKTKTTPRPPAPVAAVAAVAAAFLTLAGCGGPSPDGIAPAAGGGPTSQDGTDRVREPAARLEVAVEEEWVLGRKEFGEEALLGRPVAVRSDSRGHTYVVDKASMSVKVYGRDGRVVRAVGGRGREEGRFLTISCIEIDREDRLVVADSVAQRITVFSPEGEVVATRPVDHDQMLWPREMYQRADGGFVFLYKLPPERNDGTPRPDAGFLLHQFDADLSKKVAAFVPVEDFGPIEAPIVEVFSQTRPGHAWVERDGSVLYAPSLYRGRLYRYLEEGGAWRRVTTFEGFVPQDPPWIAVDPDAEHHYFHIKSTGRKGEIAARIRNESRGVFQLADSRVLHLSVLTTDDKARFGAELFEADGTFLGYGVIHPITDHGHTEQFYVDWKDDEDRFYIRESTDDFLVWVVRLEISLPEPEGVEIAAL